MSAKSLANAAVMIAIYLIFLVLYTIGLFPLLSSLLLPLPIIIYSLKSRKLSEIGLLVVACCIGAFILTSLFGLTTTVLYGLSGMVLGWGLVKKWPTWQRILNSAIIYMIGLPLTIFIFTGMWLPDAIMQTFNEALTMMETMLPESYAQLETMTTQLLTTIPMILPTVLLVMGMVFSYLSESLAKLIARRLKIEVPQTGNIRNLQLGKILAILFFISQIGIVFTNHGGVYLISLNIFLLLNVLFTLQGIIVLFTLFKKRGKVIPIMLITFLVMTNLSIYLSLFGVMDGLFDYRKRFRKHDL